MEKPESVRRKIMAISTLVIFSAIFSVWLVYTGRTILSTIEETQLASANEAETPSPIETIKRMRDQIASVIRQ